MKIYNLNKLVSAPSISSIYFNSEDYQYIKILPAHEDTQLQWKIDEMLRQAKLAEDIWVRESVSSRDWSQNFPTFWMHDFCCQNLYSIQKLSH